MKFTQATLALVPALLLGAAAAAQEGDMAAEQMEAMRAMLPGEHHAEMARMEGEWTATVKQWMAPGAEPMTMTGKTTYEMAFGGRYLIQHMEAEAMGMPFEGMGISGYDNTTQRHTFTWFDNMGTSMMQSDGECSDGGKVQTHVTSVSGPQGKQKIKMVSRVVSDDQHVFEFYVLGDGGAEFKQLEVTYDRVN